MRLLGNFSEDLLTESVWKHFIRSILCYFTTFRLNAYLCINCFIFLCYILINQCIESCGFLVMLNTEIFVAGQRLLLPSLLKAL